MWRLKSDRSLLLGSSIPITEIFEHDNAITSLALYTSSATAYLATGAEDGLLSVFLMSGLVKHTYSFANSAKDTILPHASQPSVVFSCQISQNRSPISGIAWYPASTDSVSPATVGYSAEKLICSTQDGYLVCLDAQGKLIVATRVDYGIFSLCIGSGNRIVVGGGDGFIHVFNMENNAFMEQCKVQYLGEGRRIAITAVKYASTRLVCCASDGSLKTWEML